MPTCHLLSFAVALVMAIGCTSLQPQHRSNLPAVLQGSDAEVRAQLLREIPIGTSRDEAERIVKMLGLELSTSTATGSEPLPLFQCSFEGRKGLFGQKIWLIQFDCPDGKVADALCEQIEIR